jgi:hypothetical protein
MRRHALRRGALLFALALVASVLLLAPATAAAATLVVSPANMQGWTPQHYADPDTGALGSQGFVSGPAVPPLGSGSYQLLNGPDTGGVADFSFEALRLSLPVGTKLGAITKLSYSTYLLVAGAAPYVLINLDLNGDGTEEDELIWEPYYQFPTVPFTWQSWDALNTKWWSVYGLYGNQGDPKTLADYLANVDHSADITILGGMRVCAGYGWAGGFVGNFDALTIGISGVETTYDFENLAPFAFNGFFQPVDNLPTWNKAKAGQAIPVKFSLGGYQGLDIFKAGYPKLVSTPCPAPKTALDAIETYAAAGGGSLTYDPASDQYNYVLKTTKGLANTGWTFDLGLKDGSDHTFWIEFVK